MPPWLQQLLQENLQHNVGSYNSQVSPVVTPANPTGVGTGGTQPASGISGQQMAAIFTAIAQHLTQQDQLAKQGQRVTESVVGFDPQGYANKISSSPETRRGTEFDPWANGTFQGAQSRYDQMANHTGLAYGPSNPPGRVIPNAQFDRLAAAPAPVAEPTPFQNYFERPFQSGGKSYPFSSAPQRKNRYSIL